MASINIGNNFNSTRAHKASLLSAVAADPQALTALKSSTTFDTQVAFVNKAFPLIPAHLQSSVDKSNFFRDFIGWCKDPMISCPSSLVQALDAREKSKDTLRKQKRGFIVAAGLNWTEAQRHEYLSQLPHIQVNQLTKPYPPQGYWIYESDAIRDQWEDHIKYGRQPDERKKRLPLMMLDEAELALDLGHDESALLFDGEQLVGVIIRNFCPILNSLNWVDGVAEDATKSRKSIRVSECHYTFCKISNSAFFFSWRTQEN
jgi:hypothetical protein